MTNLHPLLLPLLLLPLPLLPLWLPVHQPQFWGRHAPGGRLGQLLLRLPLLLVLL